MVAKLSGNCSVWEIGKKKIPKPKCSVTNQEIMGMAKSYCLCERLKVKGISKLRFLFMDI